MKKTDICIVGGGMVGMAAALALSKYNISITLIESIDSLKDSHPSYDDRTLVVNKASVMFWKNLGIWKELSSDIVAIQKVHVSNKGHFGNVRFDAKDHKIDALAYIVEAKKLGITLKQTIQKIKNISIICPAQVTDFEHDDNQVIINYSYQDVLETLSCKLMLAADGAQSQIRKSLDLNTQIKSYHRTAIVCNISPEKKHNNCAFERFTQTGPTAMLPFTGNRCGFVWTVKEKDAEEVLSLKDEDFLKQAQNHFGYRLGKFVKVGKRSSYPLYLVTVPVQVKSRTILLGNAAHSMSPVSAQGLNLAIRDIAVLVDIIDKAINENSDIGSITLLNEYQLSVKKDQDQTIKYTDDLMSWFKINNPIVNSFRSLGLVTLDMLSPIRFELFNRASGYRGNTAHLLRQP